MSKVGFRASKVSIKYFEGKTPSKPEEKLGDLKRSLLREVGYKSIGLVAEYAEHRNCIPKIQSSSLSMAAHFSHPMTSLNLLSIY